MTSAEIHAWVEDYNWDDGLIPIRDIIDNPSTEFATALLIYWRLEGPWIEADSAADGEAARLVRRVRERLTAGTYPRGTGRFDPTAELSRTQLYRLRKAGVPELLLMPSDAE